jgi:hypothetical protein
MFANCERESSPLNGQAVRADQAAIAAAQEPGTPAAELPAPPAAFPEVLDAEDLARFLRVSERSIGRMQQRGELPEPTIVARQRRWSLAEVRHWFEAGAPRQEVWEKVKELEEARRRRREQRGE